MKLNLGCGFRKKDGFINVDISESCLPDVKVDLAREIWPWETASVTEMAFEFSLDQMGETPAHLRHVFQELYRVCAPGATVKITGFHPRHDQFYLNPLCVHRISPEFLNLLSVQRNLNAIANGAPDSPIALLWGVNFEISGFQRFAAQQFQPRVQSGEITEQELNERMNHENNICHVYEVDCTSLKAEMPKTASSDGNSVSL